MIHSRLGSPASTQDIEDDNSTLEFELYEDDVGNGVPHSNECEDERTPITYDTYIGAEVVLLTEMTWSLELSSQGSRILKDCPLAKLIRTQSWTQGSTMLNSQMVRMKNWEQMSLQNACRLNVTLKVTNTGSWITLLITERTTRQFARTATMLH